MKLSDILLLEVRAVTHDFWLRQRLDENILVELERDMATASNLRSGKKGSNNQPASHASPSMEDIS
jgi:hypothetical protein